MLVLDDQVDMLDLARDMLSVHSNLAELQTSLDMLEAISIYESNPNLNLLLVDFQLKNFQQDPEENNGVSFIRKVFQSGYKGNVILYSAIDEPVRMELYKYPALKEKVRTGQISIVVKRTHNIYEQIANSISVQSDQLRSLESLSPELNRIVKEDELPSIDITPEEIGISQEVIEKYSDNLLIVLEDQPLTQDLMRAIFEKKFKEVLIFNSVDDVLSKIIQLRASGLTDEKIMIASDFELGLEQSGHRKKDGYDLLMLLRLKKSGINFKGLFMLVSGSIISKAQIIGYDLKKQDVAEDIKEKYGFDYLEKNDEDDFPTKISQMIYHRLENPFDLIETIDEELIRPEPVKPVDISFFNGFVNDLQQRLFYTLMLLRNDLEVKKLDIDNALYQHIHEEIVKTKNFFDFGKVDKKLSFNERVHVYKGTRLLLASVGFRNIEKLLMENKQLEPLNEHIVRIKKNMRMTSRYIIGLLQLSTLVDSVGNPVALEDFLEFTVGVFEESYSDLIKIKKDIQFSQESEIVLPRGLQTVVTLLLNNALEQYQEKNFQPINLINFEIINNQFILISVEDEAGGVSRDALPFLFQRRFTEKEYGSGYGLFWADEITRLLGGTLTAENTSKGAKFKIHLPLDWQSRIKENPLDKRDDPVIQSLSRQIQGVLRNRSDFFGNSDEIEDISLQIANELDVYSERISRITATREVRAFGNPGDRGYMFLDEINIRKVMPTLFHNLNQKTFYEDTLTMDDVISAMRNEDDFSLERFKAQHKGEALLDWSNIVFEKGTNKEDIVALFLSLLKVEIIQSVDDISFDFLLENQALVIDDSVGHFEEEFILLRSHQSLRNTKKHELQNLDALDKMLRKLGSILHSVGPQESLMVSSYLQPLYKGLVNPEDRVTMLAIIKEYKFSIDNKFSSLLEETFRAYAAGKYDHTFYDDFFIFERLEGWRGYLDDQINAFIRLKERLPEILSFEYADYAREIGPSNERILEEIESKVLANIYRLRATKAAIFNEIPLEDYQEVYSLKKSIETLDEEIQVKTSRYLISRIDREFNFKEHYDVNLQLTNEHVIYSASFQDKDQTFMKNINDYNTFWDMVHVNQNELVLTQSEDKSVVHMKWVLSRYRNEDATAEELPLKAA